MTFVPGMLAYMTLDPNAIVATPWVRCWGQDISRADYPYLFTFYGTLYGAGDGSTTFGLPNYRDYNPVSYNPTPLSGQSVKAVGQIYGAETVTLSAAQMPTHSHGLSGAATGSAGDHAHTAGTFANAPAGAHNHTSGTLATASAGGKSVAATALLLLSSGPNIAQGPTGTGTPYPTADAHVHTITGSTSSAADHTHVLSGTTQTTGAHTHTVTGTVANAGSSAAHDNLPPYLCAGTWYIYAA